MLMKRTATHQILLIAACAAFAAQLLAPVLARRASSAEKDLSALICTDDETLPPSAAVAARDLVGAGRHDIGQRESGFCLLCQAPAAMAAPAPGGALYRVQLLPCEAPQRAVLRVAFVAVGSPLGGRAPPRV